MSKTIITVRRKSDGKILKDVINDSCQVHNIYDGDELVESNKDYTIGYVEGGGFLDWSDYEEVYDCDETDEQREESNKLLDNLDKLSRYNTNLLIADLCARLPYNVVCHISQHVQGGDLERDDILQKIEKDGTCEFLETVGFEYGWFFAETEVRPYLRRMNTMTTQEGFEFNGLRNESANFDFQVTSHLLYDWLNKKHFDYRGLIDRGLAIEVTHENNPY